MLVILNKYVYDIIINFCLLWLNILSPKERILYVNVFLLPYVLLCYLETGTILLWLFYALIIIFCNDKLKYYVMYHSYVILLCMWPLQVLSMSLLLLLMLNITIRKIYNIVVLLLGLYFVLSFKYTITSAVNLGFLFWIFVLGILSLWVLKKAGCMAALKCLCYGHVYQLVHSILLGRQIYSVVGVWSYSIGYVPDIIVDVLAILSFPWQVLIFTYEDYFNERVKSEVAPVIPVMLKLIVSPYEKHIGFVSCRLGDVVPVAMVSSEVPWSTISKDKVVYLAKILKSDDVIDYSDRYLGMQGHDAMFYGTKARVFTSGETIHPSMFSPLRLEALKQGMLDEKLLHSKKLDWNEIYQFLDIVVSDAEKKSIQLLEGHSLDTMKKDHRLGQMARYREFSMNMAMGDKTMKWLTSIMTNDFKEAGTQMVYNYFQSHKYSGYVWLFDLTESEKEALLTMLINNSHTYSEYDIQELVKSSLDKRYSVLREIVRHKEKSFFADCRYDKGLSGKERLNLESELLGYSVKYEFMPKLVRIYTSRIIEARPHLENLLIEISNTGCTKKLNPTSVTMGMVVNEKLE